jgi:hypothetical protein
LLALTIELIEPAIERSPIDQISKKGTKLLHICIEAPTPDTAFENLRRSGLQKISSVQPALAFDTRKSVCRQYCV